MKKIIFVALPFVLLITLFSNFQEAGAESFVCYPNPSGKCNVRCDNASPFADIKIFTITGGLVKKTQSGGEGSAVIDMSGLSSGIYLVKTGGSTWRQAVLSGKSCYEPPPPPSRFNSSIEAYFLENGEKKPIPQEGVSVFSVIGFSGKIENPSEEADYITDKGANFNVSWTGIDPIYSEWKSEWIPEIKAGANCEDISCPSGYAETACNRNLRIVGPVDGPLWLQRRIFERQKTCQGISNYKSYSFDGWRLVWKAGIFSGGVWGENSAGEKTSANVAVKVNPIKFSPSVDLKVRGSDGNFYDSVSNFTSGSPTVFQWSSRDVKNLSCNVDSSNDWPAWNGPIESTGERLIGQPNESAIYTIGCQGLDNTPVFDSVRIEYAPDIVITVPGGDGDGNGGGDGSITVEYPNQVELNWSVQNADSCIASSNPVSSDWAGNVGVSGSKLLSRQRGDYQFTLSCTGPGGSSSASVNVKVISVPSCSLFKASLSSIIPPQESVLSWECRNADSCFIDNAIGMVPLEGSKTVSPTKNTIYRLTCSTLDATRIYEAGVRIIKTTLKEVRP